MQERSAPEEGAPCCLILGHDLGLQDRPQTVLTCTPSYLDVLGPTCQVGQGSLTGRRVFRQVGPVCRGRLSPWSVGTQGYPLMLCIHYCRCVRVMHVLYYHITCCTKYVCIITFRDLILTRNYSTIRYPIQTGACNHNFCETNEELHWSSWVHVITWNTLYIRESYLTQVV
jgi:hypothetical protein